MMRTPRGKLARHLYALARSTPYADDGLVYVLQAMEVEAEANRLRRDQIAKLRSKRLRRSVGSRSPAAKRVRRA